MCVLSAPAITSLVNIFFACLMVSNSSSRNWCLHSNSEVFAEHSGAVCCNLSLFFDFSLVCSFKCWGCGCRHACVRKSDNHHWWPWCQPRCTESCLPQEADKTEWNILHTSRHWFVPPRTGSTTSSTCQQRTPPGIRARWPPAHANSDGPLDIRRQQLEALQTGLNQKRLLPIVVLLGQDLD